MKTFAVTAIALALILVPSLHARRRAITPPSNKLPRDKPLADVFTPAVPDPAPGLGNCAATIKSCSAAKYCFPSTNSACVQAGFIDGQAWRVCIYATEYDQSGFPLRIKGPSKGLAVGPVDFRPSLSEPWQRVVYTAGTAEIFTGYDNLVPDHGSTRIYDTENAEWLHTNDGSYNWSPDPLTPAHVASDGFLVRLIGDSAFGARAAAECRERGIAWLCNGQKSKSFRRGEELVLWGIFDTGNYDYLIEYGFRDDGTLAFRAGATGYNNRNFDIGGDCPTGDPNQTCGNVPHVHDVLWRVDLDINGGASDAAIQASHINALNKDVEQQFNGGMEGGIEWDPEEYTSVVIEDVDPAHVNARGNYPGYEVHPLRFGNARRAVQPEEALWTKFDMWVTQWHATENTSWADVPQTPEKYLYNFSNGPLGPESVREHDLVLWYLATAHHDPIDEDRQPDGAYAVTLAHFFGFELNPHNLFPQNPLGGKICD